MVRSACTGLAPFVKSTITFLSGHQTNLITDKIHHSGQAPLVVEGYWHTWESKKTKTKKTSACCPRTCLSWQTRSLFKNTLPNLYPLTFPVW